MSLFFTTPDLGRVSHLQDELASSPGRTDLIRELKQPKEAGRAPVLAVAPYQQVESGDVPENTSETEVLTLLL